MFDDDTDGDLDDPFADLVDDDDETPADPPAPADPPPGDPPTGPAFKPKPAAAKPDKTLETLAKIGVESVKNSWIADAKAEGVVAVDFDSIPMEGFDEAAKAKFIETAKANEATERARLEALGFVYDPGKSDEQRETERMDAKDAELEVAWGRGGPTVLSTGNVENDKKIAEAAGRGDVTGVIKALGGLGDFVMRGNRQA